mgnify:FL=1
MLDDKWMAIEIIIERMKRDESKRRKEMEDLSTEELIKIVSK